MLTCHLVTPREVATNPELLALVNHAQSHAGARCLHADFEWLAETVASENEREVFYVAIRDDADGRWVGLYGAEVAIDLRRAWLRGPFVAQGAVTRFETIGKLAFDALRARFAEDVATWDAYLESSYGRALSALSSWQFESLKQNAVYSAEREHANPMFDPRIELISAPWIDDVVALTAEAFPGGYLTRDDFAAPESDEAVTFVLAVNEILVGCVHASREPGSTEGYVDYLVVLKDQRGSGFGRALLRHALAWAFAQAPVKNVALTVVAGNDAATALYESAGFQRVALGNHLRLRVVS
ncbi:MAG: GNAT family N-acetyltransferase [Betaproteobacteria bacterium]|nr:MAG: GNAT family N-acetyltransferase [Betaproteobacteria bacterium]